MKNKNQTDIVTEELRKGFEWTTAHSKIVGLVVGALLIVGAAGAAYNFVDEKKEKTLQEKYFQYETEYLKKKEQFELYTSTVNAPVDPKTKQAAPVQGTKATGDLVQDYGSVVTGLQSLIAESSNSKAATLSALLLVDIYKSYEKKTESVEVLKKVQSGRGALALLASAELGTQLANNQDCEGAIKTWSSLLQDKAAAFLVPQLKLKIGLCSETLGQKDKAQEYYKQVIAEAKDSAAGKSAEKYLRLLTAQSPTQM